MQKKKKIIISVLVAVMVVIGGFYLYASRTVAKRLPVHVYEYTSVSGNQNAYMTFATRGDQVVVNPDKDTAIKASNGASDFQQDYQDNAKDGPVGQWLNAFLFTFMSIHQCRVIRMPI